MVLLREQIASRIKGSWAENEDWWHLCYDTETQEFFVEHSWDHVQINGLTQSTGETKHDVDTWHGPGNDRIESAKLSLQARATT